ncbi:hypothetical protein GCM10009579_89290 [Streptomyces javensis]|uniref:Thioesterase domain-containing protein n=1 Tax=Streptomyces javensis TaxID=114698 RepID=A0ABP4I6H1_9ACTN
MESRHRAVRAPSRGHLPVRRRSGRRAAPGAAREPGARAAAGGRRTAPLSLRADYQAAETYRCAPDAVVGCPVTVLTGDTDPETTLPEARAWEQHTTGTCTVRTFPGGHFFITAHVGAINCPLRERFSQ